MAKMSRKIIIKENLISKKSKKKLYESALMKLCKSNETTSVK